MFIQASVLLATVHGLETEQLFQFNNMNVNGLFSSRPWARRGWRLELSINDSLVIHVWLVYIELSLFECPHCYHICVPHPKVIN